MNESVTVEQVLPAPVERVVATYEMCEPASYRHKGPPCTCAICGTEAKNLLGLRVHYQYVHADQIGCTKRFSVKGTRRTGPRGPYKKKANAVLEMTAAEPSAPKASLSSNHTNYCPQCGCNIKAVNMAIGITS